VTCEDVSSVTGGFESDVSAVVRAAQADLGNSLGRIRDALSARSGRRSAPRRRCDGRQAGAGLLTARLIGDAQYAAVHPTTITSASARHRFARDPLDTVHPPVMMAAPP
jgi:hypothetical protein